MAQFISLLISGISMGAIIALVAVGFLVVHKACHVANFAHGGLVTLGTYIAIWILAKSSVPILVAYLLSMVVMFGVGVGIERLAYAPLRTRPPLTVVIATLAASLIIDGGLSVWQGADPKPLASPVGSGTVVIFGAHIAHQRILIIGVAVVVISALMVVFQRTSFGRQLRALASDAETARLFGIRTRRLTMMAFGISAVLATLAGVLIAPLSTADTTFGFQLMVSGFAAAVLGGYGSLSGVLVGSLIIGLVQQLLGGYFLTEYAAALPFVVMFVVIAARPDGIFGTRTVRL